MRTWLTVSRSWLSAAPATLFIPLAQQRKEAYFARFTARARLGGWLVQPSGELTEDLDWLGELLSRTHVPGRTLANARWRLTWYAYRVDGWTAGP
jgi:hypothetical protein